MKIYSSATPRPLFLVGARRRNSTLYFTTTTTPRTSPETTRTTRTQIDVEEHFEEPKLLTRRPLKKNFLYSSRTHASTTTTARPSTSRVTKYRRKATSSSAGTTKPVESQALVRPSPPSRVASRFKFVSRKPTILRTRPQNKVNESFSLNPDQNLESSNQQSLEEEVRNSLETTDLTDIVEALQKIQKIPNPSKPPRQRVKVQEKIKPSVLNTTNGNRNVTVLKTNESDNLGVVPKEHPTTHRIPISTFRGTLKPKLTFKQTPVYQEVLNSQEEERESQAKSPRIRLSKQPAFKETTKFNFKEVKPLSNLNEGKEKDLRSKSPRIRFNNPPAFKETTKFNYKETKSPFSYKDSIENIDFSNFEIKELRPSYISGSSTPKPNLILEEGPFIIPVISSSYLKKSKDNNEYSLVYENTNVEPFKSFDDLAYVTLPPDQRETYSDTTYKELTINIPIMAPSSTGYFRSTTSKPRTSVSPSRVPFKSSTYSPITSQYKENLVTAAPIENSEEREITQAYVQKYSSPPDARFTKSRFRYSTTQAPFVIVTPALRKEKMQRKKGRPFQAFDKIAQPAEANTFKPLAEYDYYDDLEASILGKIPDHGKVLLHGNGQIECLDQGSFPHPVSCKKFIQCAKMENGKVYGWEYTCPKNLSFDPIGGMCNWSAGLGCSE